MTCVQAQLIPGRSCTLHRPPLHTTFQVCQRPIRCPIRKLVLLVHSSLSSSSHKAPTPPDLQNYRGYLGDTRSRKSRYSDAAVDQDKEDHRENMRTVSCNVPITALAE